MHCFKFDPDDDDSLNDALDEVGKTITPDLIENQLRQAVAFCWANLSREQRTVDNLDRLVRGAIDRVLQSAHEEFDRLGANWWGTFL